MTSWEGRDERDGDRGGGGAGWSDGGVSEARWVGRPRTGSCRSPQPRCPHITGSLWGWVGHTVWTLWLLPTAFASALHFSFLPGE